MSEKDLVIILIIGAVVACGIIGVLASKISDKRFENKYLHPKRRTRI